MILVPRTQIQLYSFYVTKISLLNHIKHFSSLWQQDSDDIVAGKLEVFLWTIDI